MKLSGESTHTGAKKRGVIVISSIILLVILLAVFPAIFRSIYISGRISELNNMPFDDSLKAQAIRQIGKDIERLERIIESRTPKSFYLVINTSSNEFTLYRGHSVVKTDKCSTGSYILLKKGDQEDWLFRTPRGEFRVQTKTPYPVWKKPDRAFVEEGLPVPPRDHYSRFEYGVLGDYALGFGQGYLIHGTLYKRFLGLPVTHGCVRLDDENLEIVYRSMSLGSRIFIY
jgi:L,D-transpeptidase YbiS